MKQLAKCKPAITTPEAWSRWGDLVVGVAGRYGLSVSDLLGHRRGQILDVARRDLYTCLYGSGFGYSEIGRLLGRDHTTILHAVRKELACAS